MSDIQHFILTTAGHVDHGKSALVKALTGTDPDRLPEEKARGITIDLGFANLELRSPLPPFPIVLLGIIDVPGHEDFVKNMVAGVGSVDLALLVVAADDGWMPQTEEHLQILTYLGVRQAAVALTKVDLVQDEGNATDLVRQKLRNTSFAEAPIIPTSITNGRGLHELRTKLAAAVARTPQPRDFGKPRLAVDRVFSLQGIGTVVTGTLTGGTLCRGHSVIIQPSGHTARIRSIQSHNQDVVVIGPGTRTALNLPNLTPGQDIHRGDVVTSSGCGGPAETIDVVLEISPRASRSIKEGARVWMHHGSSNVPASVAFLTAKNLMPGERTVAQLRLEAPIFAFVGDRFVLRDWAAQNTLAGGRVLDADASPVSFHTEDNVKYLGTRAGAPDDVQSYVISQVVRDGAARPSELLRKSHFSEADISAAVSRLIAQGVLGSVAGYIFHPAKWNAICQHAAAAVNDFHRVHPEHMGVSLNDLRTILEGALPADDLFDAVIAELCNNQFVRAGLLIRNVDHRPSLPRHLQEAGAKLRAALALKPFDPPSCKELLSDAVSQQAMRFLIETGEAVELSNEVVMAAESEKQAAELICQFIREHGPATVSDLRQTLGSSRRVIIPLLEKLDRAQVTTRINDKRALR